MRLNQNCLQKEATTALIPEAIKNVLIFNCSRTLLITKRKQQSITLLEKIFSVINLNARTAHFEQKNNYSKIRHIIMSRNYTQFTKYPQVLFDDDKQKGLIPRSFICF